MLLDERTRRKEFTNDRIWGVSILLVILGELSIKINKQFYLSANNQGFFANLFYYNIVQIKPPWKGL